MQLYRDYYKANGIRRLQEMMSPSLFNFDRLPRNAYYHNLTWDGNPDLDPSLTIFTSVSNRINVDLAETLTSEAGHPIRLRTTAKLLSMQFFRTSKHFKYVPNAHSVTMDVNSPVVMNHNYLDHLYRYPAINIAPYYRWFNIEKTRWNTIDKICDESDRQHFVVVKLPKDLLAVSILKRFQDVVNVSMLKIFDTPEELFFLQMWKWLLISSRDSTIFGNVKPKNLMKINLVIVNKRNQAVMINLGFLNSWIKLTVEEIKLVYHDQPPGMERDPLSIALQAGKQQLPPDMISKLWVRFCMTLQSNDIDDPLAEEPIGEAPGLDTPEDQVEDSLRTETEREYETQNDIEGNDNAPDDLYSDLNKRKGKPTELFDKAKLDDLNAGFNDDRDLASRLKAFDEELETLEVISKQRLKEKGLMVDDEGEVVETSEASHTELSDDELIEQIHGVKTDTEALLGHVNTAAEIGMITASDYRKMVESVNAYAKAPEPYGSKTTMAEFADVKPEDILLDVNKTTMVIPETVIDKTMATSSLNSFDPDYVNKVLRRDIVAMVSATQRGGVIVRNHEVTIDHSVMGTYEIHRLELKPVNGQVSTIAIRIPKMQPDGTFMAAGNEYVLRKQRGDAPIRKIDQLTVALTSYYGKTFVKRATRKSNSPVEWLIRKINLMGMEDHPLVKDVAPGNVFDNKLTAPYLYHALADNYRGFKVGKYVFDFSYHERMGLFSTPIDSQIVKQIEAKNAVICGAVSGKDPIVMDMSDQLYIYRDKELVHIGDMFQVLQLDQRNAPVDFAEVSIFSKSVPVGVVLGYYIGFNNLIKYLKVKFRVVEGRKQKDLQPDEYSITFKDRSYIFSRKDKKASLVLAGYLNYEKEIKAHEADQFNHRDVYFNLLDSKGLSAMYLREMEQLNQMFVDPITARILKSMNEPVTYRGLLLRSCELLLTYHHPDSQDMNQQRIRGTERIAGIIYKELVTSIRAFNNKNLSGKSKIEMSPYKVWSTIMNDQSGKITENINPIQQLKETEVITFVGEGGRAKEAMNRSSRAFHVNDTALVSEATVDSSDVGINAYLSANPNLANMYGVPKTNKEYNPANLLSTSALLAPGAYRDDQSVRLARNG